MDVASLISNQGARGVLSEHEATEKHHLESMKPRK